MQVILQTISDIKEYKKFIKTIDFIASTIKVVGGYAKDVIKLSPYKRKVKYSQEKNDFDEFYVHRVYSKILGHKISFLPSFVMPFKHYQTDIIFNIFLQMYSEINTTLEKQLSLEEPCYQTCINWRTHFKSNFSSLILEIKNRISRAPPFEGNSVKDWFSSYRIKLSEYFKISSDPSQLFYVLQEKLTKTQPPTGVFRANLNNF